MSAALAGLHYVEPTGEGDDKFTGAVAYGGYRGENAAAVGIAYKPHPNLMVSASTSVSNNQNMYNAGLGFRFGTGNTVVTRATLQKQMKYVSEENKKLKASNEALHTTVMSQGKEIRAQSEKIEQQGKENVMLKETLKAVLERLEKLEKRKE